MIDKILDRFEKILIQIHELETLMKNENQVLILKSKLFDFAKMIYLKQGNLYILDQLIVEYRLLENSFIDQNILLNDATELLNKYGFNMYQGCTRIKLDSKTSRFSVSKQISTLKYAVKEDKYKDFELLKFETIRHIRAKHEHLKGTIFMYLDLMLFHNASFKDKNETLDVTSYSDDKIKFYHSFPYGRPTLEKWIQYPTTEFLDFNKNENRKHIEKIEKVQQKLFNQALQNELAILIENLNKGNRILNYKRFIDLTENFINGKTSDIDLKRLSSFILFDRPGEVMIELDNILMERAIDFRKQLPYDGPNKKKSPRFTAELIILFGTELTKTLKIYSNEVSKIDLNGINFTFGKKIIPKHRVNSFQFIHSSTNNKRLRTILMELNNKFNIIKPNQLHFDELMEVLTCSDHTKLNIKIHIECKTSVFTYILKQLKPFFTNLTGKEIEDSKLFITKDHNSILTASNFNKSGISKMIQKEEINRIINSK